MFCVDLNSDLGESFGNYKIGLDQDIMKHVTSVNIACGWHAGDPTVMNETIIKSKEAGNQIGAHPGFPDLLGFGRRNLAVSPEEIRLYTIYQVGALNAFAKAHQLQLQHVKPHGAMYNMAASNDLLAKGIAEGVKAVVPDAILLGLANSALIRAGKEVGLKVAQEVFADRAYMADGSLVPRNQPGAVIHDLSEALDRVVRMVKEGVVTAITGETISIQADSICVHGDNPEAVQFVQKIRERLTSEGIEIKPLSFFIK